MQMLNTDSDFILQTQIKKKKKTHKKEHTSVGFFFKF